MANENSALRGEPQPSQVPGNVAEDDYKSFSDALGASARGRAFLHEYARRNRHADTEVVLAALDRLESVARSQKTAPEAERIRQDLRALLDTIRSARPQIDQTPGAIKAASLAALIEFVQARIEALVQPNNAPLASVPEPEQPELPIPQPGTAFQRTIALVEAIAPPPEPVPQSLPQSLATPREPQGFVLRLDPRVAPAARNFDPDAMLSELPRSTRIIPEVNFIDSLFNAIDAKNKAASKQESKAETAAMPAEPVVAAAPVVALIPVEAPAVTAAKLPIDMPGPVAAAQPTTIEDKANSAAIATTESIARSDATAAKINASAAAIDEIVAAAQMAMADAAMTEAAQAESAAAEAVFVEEAAIETGFVEAEFAEAVFVETVFEEEAFAEAAAAETEFAEAGFVEATFSEATTAIAATAPEAVIADAVAAESVIAEAAPQALAVETSPAKATPAVAAPVIAPVAAIAVDASILAMDNALAEIMALSDEERLALFT